MRKNLYAILLLQLLLILVKTVSAQSDWPTAIPSEVGLSKDSLDKFGEEITSGKFGFIDGMLIIRHGKLAYQKNWTHDYDKIYGYESTKKSALNPHDPGGPYNYFNPWWHPYYRRGSLHTLQSVSKTITSIVIGVAITRKEFPEISEPVLKFFDTTQVKNIDDRKRRLTIKHLLTMTSGFDWNEQLPYSDPRNDCILMEASFDWVQFVIDKPMAQEPGQSFNYNSGATQLLSHIFRKATGKDIEEYASHFLFQPLGISQFFWKRTPTGLPDTEGGLYLNEIDLSKIFYLFLKNGKWNGKEIVSESWVKSSVSPSVTLSNAVKYGYKWWLTPYDSQKSKYAWMGGGFGGQHPVAIPELDIVAVFTAWNIAPGKPSLPTSEMLRRIVSAVTDQY